MRGKVAFKIGDTSYSVDLSKSPYLASQAKLQREADPHTFEFFHEPIPHFAAAYRGLENGFRQCLRDLPTTLEDFRTLFDTYKLLQVEIIGSLSFDDIVANLKVGKSDHSPDTGRYMRGDKSLARDTVLQLLYLLLNTQTGSLPEDRAKMFNAVLYVLSHARIFGSRTRKIVRSAYDVRFLPSAKQRTQMNRWNTEVSECGQSDATTDDQQDRWFDSDDSF